MVEITRGEGPGRFTEALRAMSAEELEQVSAALDAEVICDEVEWWRATIAIDKVLRHKIGRASCRERV